MKTLPQISEAEFEVMKVVWKHAPISTNEITEKLTQTTKWSPKTIQTLIKRLVYRIINNCNKYPNCGTMYLSQRGGKHNATQSK